MAHSKRGVKRSSEAVNTYTNHAQGKASDRRIGQLVKREPRGSAPTKRRI